MTKMQPWTFGDTENDTHEKYANSAVLVSASTAPEDDIDLALLVTITTVGRDDSLLMPLEGSTCLGHLVSRHSVAELFSGGHDDRGI